MLFKRKENPDCIKCKLDKRAYTPKFDYQGCGEKKILFILPSPSPMDDEIGKFGTSIATDVLRTFCVKNNIDLQQDCWIYFSLCCSPFDIKNNPFYPEKKYIEYCRPNLYKKIKELNPKVIIPLGNAPIEALYGKRLDDCGIDINTVIQWRGKAIPDRQLNCWVCPIFDTDWYLEKERDDQAKYVYNKDFANAIDHINIDFPTFTDDNKKCKILLEYQDIIDCLRKIIETKPKMISFDYETNCKRPYPKEAKILTISLYIPELDTSYAFPLFWKEHFSTRHLNRILSLLQRVLTIEGTKYIAHQIAMEDSWTSIKLGFHINGWFWDTMVVQHIIDTTPRTCGLKPQAFFRWGIEGYDKYSKSYMTSDDDDESDDGVNNLEKANLPKVLKYNALDSLYGYRLYEEQLIESEYETNEKRKFCVDLYNEVAVAFTRTSQRGIFTNQEYYAAKQIELEESVKVLREELYDTKEARMFKRSKGIDINFDSSDHMRILFFDLLGFDPKKKTKKGNASADKEALNDIDHPFAKKVLEIRSLNKIIGTYFSQFRRLSYDGFIHPEMLLHIARSGRSCVAKGTMIEVIRDLSKNPEGIPIEDVKVGDYVYCYDKNLNLVLRKVLWSGKTGTKEICEVHWRAHGGKKTGILKVTPEHRIRMVNGKYVEARSICPKSEFSDYRSPKNKSRAPKVRCLALLRLDNDNRLFVTGKRKQFVDHRFIYDQLIGKINDEDVIHHKDGNHQNNNIFNLVKMSREEHSRYHSLTRPLEMTERCKIGLIKARTVVTHPTGTDHYNYFNYTKLEWLKLIFKHGGNITLINHDFATIKNKVKELNIDIKKIQSRFNGNKKFITRGMVRRCEGLNLNEVSKKLSVSFYKAKDLMDTMGVFYRTSKNKVPNNHRIKDVKYTGEICDVYDLEIEGEHNFIANGICVHNSCVSPNFQNINKRNKFAKEAVRTGVIPIPGYHMGEIDYDTLEVKIFCCFCKDPALVNYLMDSSSDMHKDQAREIFILTDWQITKSIRFEAKNGWVFALFYGSYWRSCARKIWDKICSQKDLILGKKNPDDPDIHLKDHLYSKGIKTQEDFAEHLKKCEEKLWNIFHVTREYQKNAFKSALKNGYVESFFGFRRGGYIERGQIINTPVQGQGCQCLLHSYRQIYKLSIAQHWKSYIVGQIHDSAVDYFHPTEIIPVLNTFRKIMCIDMVKNNDWMIVPMDIEASIGKLNSSWCNLIDFHFDKGKWITKSGDKIQDVLELPKQVRFV